jgi:hypothetical protein
MQFGSKVGTLVTDPTEDGRGLVDTIRKDDGFILVLDHVMSTGQMNFVIYEVEKNG